MARIQINNLPVLEDLKEKELKGIFGGFGFLGISIGGWKPPYRRPIRRPISRPQVVASNCPMGPAQVGTLAIGFNPTS